MLKIQSRPYIDFLKLPAQIQPFSCLFRPGLGFFFFSSAFLRVLLPCVWTNDLAHVHHTSEGAQTVRDLGPNYSDLWDTFTTVGLHLLSVRCRHLLSSHLVWNVKHYILPEPIFPFHAPKFRSFVGSRTRVLYPSHFIVRCSSTVLASPGVQNHYTHSNLLYM